MTFTILILAISPNWAPTRLLVAILIVVAAQNKVVLFFKVKVRRVQMLILNQRHMLQKTMQRRTAFSRKHTPED